MEGDSWSLPRQFKAHWRTSTDARRLSGIWSLSTAEDRMRLCGSLSPAWNFRLLVCVPQLLRLLRDLPERFEFGYQLGQSLSGDELAKAIQSLFWKPIPASHGTQWLVSEAAWPTGCRSWRSTARSDVFRRALIGELFFLNRTCEQVPCFRITEPSHLSAARQLGCEDLAIHGLYEARFASSIQASSTSPGQINSTIHLKVRFQSSMLKLARY